MYEKRVVLFTLVMLNLADQPAPEVMLQQGIVSGKVSADGTYHEYLGIPYATASEENRFQAPLPPPSWEETLKATDEHHHCLQAIPIGVVGVEDCLKINLYVPVGGTRPLPVMVYVHGGTFLIGSGGKMLYGPQFLVPKGVILVTFNYRLNILGFLCLGIKEAPGNAGLKDQVEALRWLKKNVAAFGGDPDNITVFGHSAGASAVSLLLASEMTNGLFNKAIIQSGSSIGHWVMNIEPVKAASYVAKALGFETEDPHELYKIFSQTPPYDLLKLVADKPRSKFLDTFLIHLPCIEKPIEGVEPFLTDLPSTMLAKSMKNVSVMHGTTTNEGYFLTLLEPDESFDRLNTQYLLPLDLEFENQTILEATSNRVRDFYFGNATISKSLIGPVSELVSHIYFDVPSLLETEFFLNGLNGTVYNYYFNYSGERNFMKICYELTRPVEEPGIFHGDDIMYIFKGHMWPFWINNRDRNMIDVMTTMWTDYAKYGNPTPPSAADLPVLWTPSDKDELKFLYINDALEMGPMLKLEAYRLWKDIYTKYRRKRESYTSY